MIVRANSNKNKQAQKSATRGRDNSFFPVCQSLTYKKENIKRVKFIFIVYKQLSYQTLQSWV